MGLIERTTGIDLGIEEKKLSIHSIVAALHEVVRGKKTVNDIVTDFDLSTEEKNEFIAIKNKIEAGDLNMIEVWEILLCAEDEKLYKTVAEVKTRLGF